MTLGRVKVGSSTVARVCDPGRVKWGGGATVATAVDRDRGEGEVPGAPTFPFLLEALELLLIPLDPEPLLMLLDS